MKRLFASLIALMFIMSIIVVAQEDVEMNTAISSEDEIISGEEEIADEGEELTAEEEELEEALEEYEDEEEVTPEELAVELEKEADATDEEIAEEAGLSDEETSTAVEVDKKIGVRQYVLNIQLRRKIKHREIVTKAIIDFLKEQGKDVSKLEELRNEMMSLKAVNEERLTGKEFADRVVELRRLSKEFRDEVKRLVANFEKEDLKKAVKEALEAKEEEIDEIKAKEERYRKFHNKRVQVKEFKKIKNRLIAIGEKEEGVKLGQVRERYRILKDLQSKYLGQNASKENVEKFREEWKEQIRLIKGERENARVLARKAKAYEHIKKVRIAIRDAKKAGEPAEDLETQYNELRKALITVRNSKDIKKFRGFEEEAKNISNDKRIKARVKEAANIIRGNASERVEDDAKDERLDATPASAGWR